MIRPALRLLLLAACLATASAAVPSGFSDGQWVGSLPNGTAMAFAPDGRLFVCLQTGQLRVIKGGALLPTPFATFSVDSNGERGLLGVAFDPNFAANGYVYVYHTDASTSPLRNRVTRLVANGDVETGARTVILDLDPLSGATNHNGGALHFGPDGYLYVAVGENANGANSQTLANRLGKILRIAGDGSIPTSNPFYGTASGANRAIWAMGLRNPFTFAFQPGSGRMFINDVGQNTWEEIDQGVAGANYGWPNVEGVANNPAYTDPLYAYGHGGGPFLGCAITGGAFYDPPTQLFPAAYRDKFFFADYCGGWINLFDPATGGASTFASGVGSAVDLLVGPDGALYYLTRDGGGSVHRIGWSQAPAITQQPQNVSVAVGGSATFTAAASGTPAPGWRWQRNGVDIPGATSASYTLSPVAAGDNGARFRAIASNGGGSATTNEAVLTVTGANTAPTATITAPAAGTSYAGGQTIAYAGTGSDAEDGALPASAFTWEVVFHHDAHTHPFLGPIAGVTGGSFTIPTQGETAATVFYRIRLTVRDSAGATTTVERDVVPRTTAVTLASSPAGVGLTLDGQPFAAGGSFVGVEGMQRTIGAPASVNAAGAAWSFDSWSDGGAMTHAVATPVPDTAYTAVYHVAGGAVGSGSGLSATYWDNADFTGASLARVDRTVLFDWGDGSPAPSIGADSFSARWTGDVQAQFSETYTFYLRGDDGIRLRVAGQTVIDRWTDQAPTEWSGSIALTAGQRVPIVIEYYENGGGAVCELRWSSASTPKSAVPMSQLYPTGSGRAPYGGTARAIPGTIEAEDFDEGGEGVAYHDLDPSNNGGGYRAGGVDIRGCVDVGGGWQVGWMGAGEWLEYSVAATTSASYDIAARVASGSAGATIHVSVDGVDRTGALSFGNTGGWDTWQTVTHAGGSIAAGAHLVRLSVDSGSLDLNWLRFTSSSGGIVSGGWYKLVAKHSGKCLDVAGASTANGANVQQWSDNGSTAQQWRVDALGDGSYSLTARCSGQVLDVAGGSLDDGGNVIQWPLHGGPNQHWRLQDAGDGWYNVVSVNSGKLLDVSGVSTADGANVHQWTAWGGDNQKWSLVPVAPTAIAAADVPADAEQALDGILVSLVSVGAAAR